MLFILSLGLLNSCVDDEANYDLNDDGTNLAGFALTSTTVSGIADGTEYQFDMKVRVTGPTKDNLKNDITVTVEVDEDAMAAAALADATLTPAIEGTHYRIDNPTVVLKAADNYLGLLTVTMTTEGIETPLAKNPALILKVVSATGEATVINNGKPLKINMNFACFSEFQGTYDVVCSSSAGVVKTREETIIKIDVEKYMTNWIGTWAAPLSDHGVVFENSCNVLTVPFEDLLAGVYGNDVFGHKAGDADPITGVLTIYYTIKFDAGDVEYKAVYTPKAGV